MTSPSTWGDEIVLQLASNLLEVDIHIISAFLDLNCQKKKNTNVYIVFRRPRRSPPRAPAPIPCSSRSCSHTIVCGHHFSSIEWDDYRAEDEVYRRYCRTEDSDENV